MTPTSSIVAFAIPATLAIALTGVAKSLAVRTQFVAVAREDRFHIGTVPLLGGVAVLAAMAVGLAICRLLLPDLFRDISLSRLEAAYLVGLLGFLAIGLVDDRRSLSPIVKGLGQGLILAAVFFLWRPEGTILAIPAAVVAWAAAMLLLNAWNYLDHADGVFATAAVIGAAVLAIHCRSVPDVGILPVVLWGLAGAMAGFLVWNLPPARIFLGDAGALPVGFTLAFVSILLVTKGSTNTLPAAFAPHALALADFLLVTIVRLASGRNPFVGGREHTGHRLTAAIGPWNCLAVVLVFVFAAGFGAILLGRRWPMPVSIAWPVASLAVALLLSRMAPPAPRNAVSKSPKRGRRRGSGAKRSV